MKILDYSISGGQINLTGENGNESFEAQLPLRIFQQYLEEKNKIGDVEVEYPLSHPDDPNNRNCDTYYLQVSFREYLFQTSDEEIYEDIACCATNNIAELQNYRVWVS